MIRSPTSVSNILEDEEKIENKIVESAARQARPSASMLLDMLGTPELQELEAAKASPIKSILNNSNNSTPKLNSTGTPKKVGFSEELLPPPLSLTGSEKKGSGLPNGITDDRRHSSSETEARRLSGIIKAPTLTQSHKHSKSLEIAETPASKQPSLSPSNEALKNDRKKSLFDISFF